jgi:flagellar hook-associated protein 3 FlgL
MSDSDRLTIAGTLQSSLEQLHGLANTDDGNGQFLFAGFKSSSAPFSKQSDGSIAYSGDQGKRLVQVDVDRQMAISDDGRSIFQSVQDGAGYVSTSSTANAGSGVFSATSIINTADTSFGKDFVVSFPTATTYQIDTTGTPATSITPATPFKPGAAIGFAGLQISISGAPAAGDTFSVSTAKNAGTDVFAAISDVISALKIPLTGGGAPAQAKVFNALSTANRKIDNSLNNVLTTTSSVGSRLQELVSLGTTGDNRNLYDKIYLSSLQDLDYASAISELYQRKTSLQASQQTFVKLQKDALINYI